MKAFENYHYSNGIEKPGQTEIRTTAKCCIGRALVREFKHCPIARNEILPWKKRESVQNERGRLYTMALSPRMRLHDNDPCCGESMTPFAVRRYAFSFTDHRENPPGEEEE
jgi:hypothetical protein